MTELAKVDAELAEAIQSELTRQHRTLELIASENHVSEAVLEAQGSVFTNKYAEGYPGKRYYGGCGPTDRVERLAIERCKQLFGADHVNVQPHSGSQANMAVYLTVLKPGDTLLGMNLSHGGHLTHGHPINFSGFTYRIVPYGVAKETETIDYDELRRLAVAEKPKLIVAGASAYARTLDFERFRAIADEVGALLMVDIAHIAGLVATGLHPSPVPLADFVTSTTHKTLRGPRGGLVMCKERFAKDLDRRVFPGIQGGPLVHVIAAKAVAFLEAQQPAYKEYIAQVVKNAAAMAQEMSAQGYRVVSGGTDNHLFLLDVLAKGLTGKVAEKALEDAYITVNKNTIPFDTQSPMVTSGLRIGTPAVTTRGMKEAEMREIGQLIARILREPEDRVVREDVEREVTALCDRFPLYGSRRAHA